MLRYTLRRLVLLAVSLVLAVVVLFVLLRLLPGDPASSLLSMGAGPAQVAAARRQLGTNLPIARQLVLFVIQLVHLNFGRSFISQLPVAPEIANRLSVTIPLTLISFLLALIIAIPLGIVAAVKSNRWYGAGISTVTQLGIAIPVFWVGILLVTLFAVHLRLFPSGGFPNAGWNAPLLVLRSLTLPVITIAIVMSASLIRYVRAATLDVVGSDYIRTARALGATFGEALRRHGIRNGSVPVVSILGIELATTFLGAVVVERVFTLPGLGSMLLVGIEQRDYPNVQGVLFVSTLLVLIIGFLADFAQRLIDPRLRDKISKSTR